jgi:hypothetical protein
MSPLIGAVLLAVGRTVGMARFSDTVAAFMASLAPLVAFPLVGAVFLLLGGSAEDALTTLLLTMVAQLTPAVVSHALAVRWGREAEWLRYATAFNWCQWAIPAAAFVLMVVVQIATAGGVSDEAAGNLLIVALAAYALWLHYVLARAGLRLGRGRSVALVLIVNFVTVALVLGPRWLAGLLTGGA